MTFIDVDHHGRRTKIFSGMALLSTSCTSTLRNKQANKPVHGRMLGLNHHMPTKHSPTLGRAVINDVYHK